MQMKAIKKRKVLGISLVVLLFAMAENTRAQEKQMVRIAKIKVYPTHLDAYNKALKEQMNTAILVEPGVLTYYAVSDKNAPTNITILEIYADTIAYQSHIETVHFKKYKTTVKDMVQLERNRERENSAFAICIEKIEKFKVPMKLLRTEYTFDRSKIVFFFTAEGRVDFRELVKELASVFHTRIELRQVGVRDEA